ncbi:MAG: tRNA lysidine(34) synthetase TilS [Clostridia bacterium]|nr:tRNA lysidine(34) synthetase TilS [Clostridia bacterium]
MLNKVIKTIDRYEMLKYADMVTVALSGGADSVCLLYILNELADRYGVKISAIHINHMLRGEESNRDEAFVRELCKRENIPLTVKRIDITSLAEQTGESIELAARKARYNAFSQIDTGVVATAHSADDNLETVIYNITRGSGLTGVCGIPPKRDIYIRPLIACSRYEIEDYLRTKGATFVTDSSNLTDDYTRNFIRHNIVPMLKSINPSAEQTVTSMCSSLREDEEFLKTSAKRVYALTLREDFLDAELLKIQPSSVIKRVIALYLFDKFSIKTDALHLENCKDILLNGGKTSMNGNLTAVCKGEKFYFTVNGENAYNEIFVVKQREVLLESLPEINKSFLKNAIDCDKIDGKSVIRTRAASDEIRLFGRRCTKSLKKLMNELKIPEELRDAIPIASDDSGVIWIYGIGVAERVAVTENTKKAIEFITNKS